MSNGIVFQVETRRILEILAKEIYDSPLALLRENVQNAYDAVRMRFVNGRTLKSGGRIRVTVGPSQIEIEDNGVGMSREVLTENFWKAGSSGKRSQRARDAGVVGTFGIGAMANFGVCTELRVETRAEGSTEALVSVAKRDDLRIGERCIELDVLTTGRDIGTKVTAVLDSAHRIEVLQARQYLEPYVATLPVPVELNGENISGASLNERLPRSGRTFTDLGAKALRDDLFTADCHVQVDVNGQVLVELTDIRMSGVPVDGRLALLQGGGQLFGLRSSFGLAPIPSSGHYQFGGFADLEFLTPTAGREALSRDSIQHVQRLITLIEATASEFVADADAADKNNGFLHWILAHGRYALAKNLTIRALPDDRNVCLGGIEKYTNGKPTHYYTGTDPQLMATFATESACLLQVARGNPRQRVQLGYLKEVLKIPQVPDSAQVTRIYQGTELSVPEASILIRTSTILREDYLIPDVRVTFADISHGVTVLSQRTREQLEIFLARGSQALPPLLEVYEQEYRLFSQFVKDFVRVHIYPRIQQFVPSSTRQGVDALRKVLQRSRELYRYEEEDLGELEGVLGDYLSGRATLAAVVQTAKSTSRAQTQRVSRQQVGSLETVVPDVVNSPVQPEQEAGEWAASPPILREDVESDMKVLTTSKKYAQLNGFTVLLGLSDRLMKTEAAFFRTAHTTRVLWGGHRVIYIFTEATGRLSLYYDIELREPIAQASTGGGPFRTTTLITKHRIFVPVPEALAAGFRPDTGAKEFYVRFDLLSADGT